MATAVTHLFTPHEHQLLLLLLPITSNCLEALVLVTSFLGSGRGQGQEVLCACARVCADAPGRVELLGYANTICLFDLLSRQCRPVCRVHVGVCRRVWCVWDPALQVPLVQTRELAGCRSCAAQACRVQQPGHNNGACVQNNDEWCAGSATLHMPHLVPSVCACGSVAVSVPVWWQGCVVPSAKSAE